MARGWESKSVEAQIDMAAQHSRGAAGHRPLDSNQLNLIRQKENLLLSRTRVVHDLTTAQNPRHKAMLEKALADLDAKLSVIVD